MNFSTVPNATRSPQAQKPSNIDKIKLNDLSEFIFKKIRQQSPLNDSRLMELLAEKFGEQKLESLKRRKYDVINILENSGIILLDKENQANIKYLPKSILLNAVKDVQDISRRVQQKQKLLQKKRLQLKMLKCTKNNYEKLVQINMKRQTKEEQRIQLPIVIATQQFSDYNTNQNLKGSSLALTFPPKTKYINNILAAQNIIKSQF